MADNNRYLDNFIRDFEAGDMNTGESGAGLVGGDRSPFCFDDIMKQRILRRTFRRVRRMQTAARYAAVACIALLVISYFTPNTPVFALRQAVLSYIPGIGVVRNAGDSDIVSDVLACPVRVVDGDKFVEIRAGFIKGDTLAISGLTNVGTVDAAGLGSTEEYKDIYSEVETPHIYLIRGDTRIKAGLQVWAGPSFETGSYKMNAYFNLDQETAGGPHILEMDGFGKSIEISLTPTKTGILPEEIGSATVVDGVMIFANITREKDIVEALVSIIAPDEYQNPRCYLFRHEKALFESGICIVDEDGVRYEPDEDLRAGRDEDINTFYFHVPGDRNGLKLVVPQILFESRYRGNDLAISMPGEEGAALKRQVQLGSYTVSLDGATLIAAGADVLPEDFKPGCCLEITTSATAENGSRESILRLVPEILLPGSGFPSPGRVSQSVQADFWEPGRNGGCSFVCFDHMREIQKIIIHLTAEIAMAGPWEIPLKP